MTHRTDDGTYWSTPTRLKALADLLNADIETVRWGASAQRRLAFKYEGCDVEFRYTLVSNRGGRLVYDNGYEADDTANFIKFDHDSFHLKGKGSRDLELRSGLRTLFIDLL